MSGSKPQGYGGNSNQRPPVARDLAKPPCRRRTMRPRLFVAVAVFVAVAGIVCLDQRLVQAGEQPAASGYKVLEPIRHGSLTVFPVAAPKSYVTAEFLTLDEGLRSGDVVVTEYGNVRGLLRRHHIAPPMQHESAEVNRLVLINNSKRPLLLLAGEIVAGGKQDRVIGKDRIVPAESDPIDLSVFCVEPGRWVGTSDKFGSGAGVGGGVVGALMAAPSVRSKAMADKDQAKVWSEVKRAQTVMAETVTVNGALPV